MNIQTKSSVLVLSIFIFGIICGFFLHSVIVPDRFHRPRFDRGGPELSHRLESILQLSPAQGKQIDPVLKKYDKKLLYTLNNARLHGMAVMDSMKAELKPLLTEKQNEILTNELERFKNPPGPPHEPMP